MSASSAPEARYSFRKTFIVETSAEHAFRVLTEQIGKWWPLVSHHIGQAAARAVIIEPGIGGRWYEQGEDGTECDWGRVLAWEPPDRLLLAWQLRADWTYDPDFLTEVEFRFVPEGDRRTRVHFEHRKLEAYGREADKMRDMVGAEGGWPVILKQFAECADRADAQ